MRWLLLALLLLAAPAVAAEVSDPALRAELLRMMEADQAAREQFLLGDSSAMEEVDRTHGARLRALVEEGGWPGHARVGEDGAHAMWLLVQHQDADPAFQRRCLELLRVAVQAGDAAALDLAYLEDRVLLAEGQEQVYGTQFIRSADGEFVPRPIRDPDHVDERRRSVGLPPLEEYAEKLRELYRGAP